MVTGFHISITQNSQDAATNRSNVTVALTITWNGGSFNASGNAAGVLNIDGTDYSFTAKFNTAQKNSGSEVIFQKTLEISHSTDGSKTLACSASFATGTGVGTVTANAKKTLTTIPRESTIGATDANVGATSVISVSRKNANYTHSIAYSFGTLQGYLADESGTLSDTEVKLSGTSLSFPIPESFYDQIPDRPWGRCTLTVRTYCGNTRIGEEKSCTITVTAPESLCGPEVSGWVTDVNERTVTVTGDANKLVRGMSDAQCTIVAQAKCGAALKSTYIGNAEVSGDTRILKEMENSTVSFAAIDSRGYRSAYIKTVEMVEYVKLTCSGEALRTDPTSGSAILTVSGNYFDGSFGAQDNALQLDCQPGSGEVETIEHRIEGNRYFATVKLTGLDYRSEHTVKVVVADQLMTLEKNFKVGKGIPVFDWGEQDFNFHVPVMAKQGVNGVFMGAQTIEGSNALRLQSVASCFDDTGKGRQTFFITGCANGLPVYGLVGVWLKDGSTFISGTGIASATAERGTGQVTVAFETTPWDTFTVISNGAFQFV